MPFPDKQPISTVILYDQNGNQILGQKAMAASVPVAIAANQSAIPVTQSVAAVALGDIVNDPLTESGGSDNMVVDGSSVPVVFDLVADPTDDILIDEVRFLITTDNTLTDNGSFFEKSTLPSGCLFEIRSGGVTTALANFKITEDFLFLPSANIFNLIDFNGLNDIFSVGWPLPDIVLAAGSSDFVKVTIRDLINDDHIKYLFKAVVFGRKKTP